ncbi:MAG: hypothetical protein QM778_36755 [Myxococcales bacterium]
MATLREMVADPGKRQQVVDDAIKVIDAEVSDKGGLGGMAIKAAYSMAKGVAPGIIQKVLNNMLDDLLGALQPYFDESKAKKADFKNHVVAKGSDVANSLLAVTDARASRASGGALKKGYEKLRPTAQKHVEQALPRLADLVTKHAN